MKKQRPPIAFYFTQLKERLARSNAENEFFALHLVVFKSFVVLALMTISLSTFGQTSIITGRIVDSATNQGISAATIRIKNTTRGVISRPDGTFTISAPKTSILQITSVNYKTIEFNADGAMPLQISLTAVNKALAEVVVVGYGTAKRSDITGSVSSVPKDRLSDLPVSNVLQAIEGTVAGVTITTGTNVPGESPGILIRGVNTINGRTNPLLVIDGTPFENLSLSDINTNDIASIDILKDVSATAVYGTRGANGVILITTKRGKIGPAAITFNLYAGPESFAHKVNPMSPQEYVQKYADWKTQAGVTNNFAVPNLYEQQNYAAGKSTNWLNDISQNGFIQDYTLGLSGGDKNVKYYVSGDYFNERGILKGYQNKRGSLRSNIDATINKYLSAGANLYYVANNQDGGRVSLQMADEISPYGTLKNPDGSYAIYPMEQEEAFVNPLLGTLTTRHDRRENLISNVFAEIKPIEGLKYRINLDYNYQPTQYQNYQGRAAGSISNGNAEVDNSQYTTWVLENILTYEKNWGKNHIDLTGLYSAQKNTLFQSNESASGFINDALQFNNLQGATNFAESSQSIVTTIASQMFRVNYSFDSKYLITATARRDGYSAFGSNTSKYGLFPSVALAWNIEQENFMKGLTFINSLKLRGSYGLSGNQSAVIPNSTITTYTTTSIPSNGKPITGVVADVLGNSDLKWESTYGTNLGIDFSVFNNRISGTINAYSTKTKDLVLYRNLPAATGYLDVVSNIGKVGNKGIEVTLKTENIASKDFGWETTLNFAANRNKILELYGDNKSDVGNRLFLGKPVNIVYGYKLTGIWQQGEDPSKQNPGAVAGDLKFADLDHSGTITSNDQTILGQTIPKWTGGLTNTFRYKSIRLSVFIQTVQGVMANNDLINFQDFGGRENLPSGVGYWTTGNKSNTRPSLTYVNYLNYGYPQDASYTRIKDATLSYTMPKALSDKLKLGGLTIYVSGRNLATFTKWFGWDPEAGYGTSGDTEGNYPLVRSFILGANITLR